MEYPSKTLVPIICTFDNSKAIITLELWEIEEIKRALERMNKQRGYSNAWYEKNSDRTSNFKARKPRLIMADPQLSGYYPVVARPTVIS